MTEVNSGPSQAARGRPSWQVSLGIFLVALLIRVVVLGVYQNGDFLKNERFSGMDEAEYDGLATNLAKGLGYQTEHGWLTEPGQPYVYRPPGYPLFLAAIYLTLGHNYVIVRFAQAVVSALIPVLLWWLARRMLPEGWSLGVALAASVNPFLVYWEFFLMADLLYVTLFTAAVVATVVARDAQSPLILAAVAGFIQGLAALTRGEALYLGALPLLYLWLGGDRRTSLLKPSLFLLGLILPILPWTVRNYAQFHRFIPIQSGALGLNLALSMDPKGTGQAWPGYEEWQIDLLKNNQKLAREQREPHLVRESLAFYSKQPRLLLSSLAAKAMLFWKFTPSRVTHTPTIAVGNQLSGKPPTEVKTPYQGKSFVILSLIGYVVYLPLFVLSVILVFLRKSLDQGFLLAIILGVMAISVLTVPSLRSRGPVMPEIILLAFTGAYALAAGFHVSETRLLARKASEGPSGH